MFKVAVTGLMEVAITEASLTEGIMGVAPIMVVVAMADTAGKYFLNIIE